MRDVSFAKGNYAGLPAENKRDAFTFYYCVDTKQLFLGSVELTQDNLKNNLGDLSALSTTTKASLVAAINEIFGDINDVSTKFGSFDNLKTTTKSNLVEVINELYSAVNAGGSASAITLTENTTSAYANSYTLKQGEAVVGTINIPKDMVIKSGTVVKNPEGQDAGTYIELTIANDDSTKIYINVKDLIDVYTHATGATQVQINVSNNEISATLVDGGVTTAKLGASSVTTVKIADKNVTKAKLSASLQASIDNADAVPALTDRVSDLESKITAVDSIDTTIQTKLNTLDSTRTQTAGTDGLALSITQENGVITKISGSIAADTYDAHGAASTAETNAKAYTDSALTWTNF